MKLEEVWTFHVPVREVGLTHEGVGIGEESVKTFDDGVRFVFVGGLSAHVKLGFEKNYPSPAACATRYSPLC